jgi:hypothetical protein
MGGCSDTDASHSLMVDMKVTYATILVKVMAVLEWGAQAGARWLLKTDDDSYINVPQTVQVRFSVRARALQHTCCM